MKVSGWGKTLTREAKLISISNAESFAAQLRTQSPSTAIPRGNGRSYGSQAIPRNAGAEVWSSRALRHFLSFDENSGLLEVETGVTLGEIQKLFIPRGWALPVTPGTQFVTVGGAIANDIHGKNHHSQGTFGEHVEELTLIRSDGQVLVCNDRNHRALMRATIGGMGLTGFIASAKIRLRAVQSAFIDAQSIAFRSIEEFWRLTEESKDFEYTVSWLDIRKKSVRGIFNRGNQSETHGNTPNARVLSVPFTPPFSLFNRFTTPILAQLYWLLGSRNQNQQLVHYSKFFYPLDGILHWNRAYGRNGFYQHQALIPTAHAIEGLNALIAAVAKSGLRSAVSVLKTTGHREAPGMLTYPIEGVTLAMDFAANVRSRKLMDTLDRITIEHGGRVNPSKDVTMSAETFSAGFAGRLAEFEEYRDPRMESGQSYRLLGETKRNK